jgi:hypothetical protein
VQHEVVVPAGDRDRVELDRPELPDDLEHPVEASRERPRGREKVPRDDKATRRLSSDLHLEDASRESPLSEQSGWCDDNLPVPVTVASPLTDDVGVCQPPRGQSSGMSPDRFA